MKLEQLHLRQMGWALAAVTLGSGASLVWAQADGGGKRGRTRQAITAGLGGSSPAQGAPAAHAGLPRQLPGGRRGL